MRLAQTTNTGAIDTMLEPDGRRSARSLVSRLLSWSVLAVLAVVVAVVWWARNRGLDVTDEGLYLQLYAHPEAASPETSFSQFNRLVDTVTGDIGIVGYRLLGLGALVLSGGFFGFSVDRFVRRWLPQAIMPPRLMTVSFVTVGGLLGYSWAPLTISYNTLSGVLVHTVSALVLLALAASAGLQQNRTALLFGLSAGAIFPLLFFVKWPAAIMLVVVLSLFVVVVAGKDGSKVLLAAGAGAVVVFTLVTTELLGSIFSLAALIDRAANAPSAYQPADLARNYSLRVVAELARVFWQDPVRLVALVAVLIGGSLGIVARSHFKWLRPWMFPALGAAYLVLEIPTASYVERLTVFKLVAALAVALAVSFFVAHGLNTGQLPEISITKLTRTGRLSWSVMLLCFALPLVTAFGSNPNILTSSMHGGAGHAAAFVVGVAMLRTLAGEESRLGLAFAVPIITLAFAAQIIDGVVYDPYRLIAARVDQATEVPGVPRLEGIQFDEETAFFFGEINRVVTEETSFTPGDEILAFASVPGFVYMVDGISPAASWILPRETNDQGDICYSLRTVPDAVAATKLIIQNSEPSAELAECLRELLPGYPERFVEAGHVAIPAGYGSGTGRGDTVRVFESRG